MKNKILCYVFGIHSHQKVDRATFRQVEGGVKINPIFMIEKCKYCNNEKPFRL